jgi:F1F0 ATPase subunit 2
MTGWLALLLSFVTGAALGGLFFGGLWWTVQRLTSSKHPALMLGGSFMVRMGIALAGLDLISGGRWQRLVAGLLGFAIARALVQWGPPNRRWPRPLEGTSHAS